MKKVKAIFLDRDGVINVDKGYVYKIEDFVFVKNIFLILNYLQDKGFSIFIITNQSGINRGYYSYEDFKSLTNWMLKSFNNEGIEILDLQFCPHLPTEKCSCRKPKTGMFDNISKNHDIDLEKSWLIGDRASDIEFAFNSKIKNKIYFDTGKYSNDKLKKCFIIKELIEIKNYI